VLERDGLLAAIDVLQFDDATGGYTIHEIKSSTRIEDHHLYDVAFQVVLLRKSGRKVSRACLVHLNPNYTRQGELDLERVFVSVDMTSRVEQISDAVTKELDEARAYLLSETEPKGPCPCIYKGRATAAPFDTPIRTCLSTESMTSRALAIARKGSENWWMAVSLRWTSRCQIRPASHCIGRWDFGRPAF
jgi:hypothetical protein